MRQLRGIIAVNDNFSTWFLQIMDQVIGKAVVIVNEKHLHVRKYELNLVEVI